MRVLVVEDEPALARAVRESLGSAGFTVDEALDGDEGLRLGLAVEYDAIVLDLMLPGVDGWTILRRLRESRRTPVLILTARDAISDKVACLDAGADDYLTKPFELEELKARVRALVRRGAGVATPVVSMGAVTVDLAARTVSIDGGDTPLSPKEFALLELLVLRRGSVVTRTMIYEHIWGEDDDTWSNVVDVYISTLRAKLGHDLIETRRGHGYIIGAEYMMIRSIRWTLLFWYAVILVFALAALGWALLAQMERALYRDADAQLAVWLATARHTLDEHPAEKLGERLATTLPGDATFRVWDATGDERAGAETVGRDRVLRERLPNGRWLMVGTNVEDEHHGVRDFLVVLLSASAAIIVIALAGGWLLVGRALAPVERIADTARRISGENLGERIDADRIHNELGGLAHTLNQSFDRLETVVARQVRFTADASHELRTPLAIALSHLELAATQDQTEAQLRERLPIVRDAARRMQSVVEGLLTLARADAGELQIERNPVDLAPLLDDVLTAVQPLAARRNITIDRHLSPVTVLGDRDRLNEIALNLCSNAVQYSQDGGTVTVTIGSDGGDALLRVGDTGIGIADTDQPRVFERFFRADAARTRAHGGTGLGLAVVHHLVGLHGGEVSVRSRLGEGSEFTVRLPSAS